MIPESENSGTPPAENPEAQPRSTVKRARVRRKIRGKARRIVEEVFRDPDRTNTEIARAVGSPPNYVGKVLRNPSTQQLMQDMMENDPELRLSLSRRALLVKLREGLEATQVQRFADKGRVKTEKTDPDFRCRGFYLNLAAEITGAKSQKVELTGAQGAPLIPDGLTKALEALDEATLLSLIKKLSATE